MDTAFIQEWFETHVMESPENSIKEEWALSPEMIGTRIFDAPLVCVASADDPLFKRIKSDENVLGDAFMLPEEWLPGAKSIISVFYPFSEAVRTSNYDNLEIPSGEWLHGRVEGHDFIHETDKSFATLLEKQGFRTCIPALQSSFVVNKREPEDARDVPMFTSNWSERHVAWIAGLGTFGLCTHLITEKGKAGRIGSIITTAELTSTVRPYGEDPFAYCTHCGECTKHCPVDALSLESGKDFQTCWAYMEETKVRFKPRYGCGKCQLQIPCEARIPNKRFCA